MAYSQYWSINGDSNWTSKASSYISNSLYSPYTSSSYDYGYNRYSGYSNRYNGKGWTKQKARQKAVSKMRKTWQNCASWDNDYDNNITGSNNYLIPTKQDIEEENIKKIKQAKKTTTTTSVSKTSSTTTTVTTITTTTTTESDDDDDSTCTTAVSEPIPIYLSCSQCFRSHKTNQLLVRNYERVCKNCYKKHRCNICNRIKIIDDVIVRTDGSSMWVCDKCNKSHDIQIFEQTNNVNINLQNILKNINYGKRKGKQKHNKQNSYSKRIMNNIYDYMSTNTYGNDYGNDYDNDEYDKNDKYNIYEHSEYHPDSGYGGYSSNNGYGYCGSEYNDNYDKKEFKDNDISLKIDNGNVKQVKPLKLTEGENENSCAAGIGEYKSNDDKYEKLNENNDSEKNFNDHFNKQKYENNDYSNEDYDFKNWGISWLSQSDDSFDDDENENENKNDDNDDDDSNDSLDKNLNDKSNDLCLDDADCDYYY